MTKLAGSLQHLGGDKWRYRVFIGYRPDGSQQTRSKAFRAADRKAALRKAVPIANALEAERTKHVQARGTVGELANEWLELKARQGRSPATLQGYEGIVGRIVQRFGSKQVADLTGRDVDRWYADLIDGGMSAATLQHHHAVLRGMLRQAEKWELVASVATRRASPPEVHKKEMVPPTDEVLSLLMKDTVGDFANAVRVLAGTGIRRGELCGLWWSDLVGNQLTVRRSILELKGGGMHTKIPKGKRPRTFTVGPDVLRAIKDQRGYLEAMAVKLTAGLQRPITLPDDGPIFADLKADPSGMTCRRPWWVSNQWIQLRDRHGVTFRLHDLRHWNGTKMANEGIAPATGAARLGHAQVSTFTNNYTHRDATLDTAAAELLSGALAP